MLFSQLLFKIEGRKFPTPISIQYVIYLVRRSVSQATNIRIKNNKNTSDRFGDLLILTKALTRPHFYIHDFFVLCYLWMLSSLFKG